MTRTAVLAALLIATVPILAQPPASTPPPGRLRAPRSRPAGASRRPAEVRARRAHGGTAGAAAPRREGQPVNIKIDFTITDQRGGAAGIKRTLTLIVADERTGSIRSQSTVFQVGDVPLNVDASPSLLTDGKIRLGFNLQYDWPAPFEGLAASQTRPAADGHLHAAPSSRRRFTTASR